MTTISVNDKILIREALEAYRAAIRKDLATLITTQPFIRVEVAQLAETKCDQINEVIFRLGEL